MGDTIEVQLTFTLYFSLTFFLEMSFFGPLTFQARFTNNVNSFEREWEEMIFSQHVLDEIVCVCDDTKVSSEPYVSTAKIFRIAWCHKQLHTYKRFWLWTRRVLRVLLYRDKSLLLLTSFLFTVLLPYLGHSWVSWNSFKLAITNDGFLMEGTVLVYPEAEGGNIIHSNFPYSSVGEVRFCPL